MEKAIEIKRRAQRCILNGDLDGALGEYEKLIATGDSDPYHSVLLADLLFKKGDHENASKRYLDAVDGYERMALYKNAIAVCKKMSRLSLAPELILHRLANLHALDGLATESTLYYMQHAEQMVQRKEMARAIESLRRAFQVCSDNVKALERLGEVQDMSGSSEEAAQTLLDAASHYERLGQLAEAKRCESRAHELSPNVGAREGTASAATPTPAASTPPSGPATVKPLSMPGPKPPMSAVPLTARPISPAIGKPLAHPGAAAAAPVPSAVRSTPEVPGDRAPAAPEPPAVTARDPRELDLDGPPPSEAVEIGETNGEPAAVAEVTADEEAVHAMGGESDEVTAADSPPTAEGDDDAFGTAGRPSLSFDAPAAAVSPSPLTSGPGLPEISNLLNEAQTLFEAGEREAASSALVRAAQAYDRLERFESAASIYRSLSRVKEPPLQVMMLWLKNCQRRDDRREAAGVACELGDRALMDGDTAGARGWFERARTYDTTNELAARRLDRLREREAAPVAAVATPEVAPESREVQAPAGVAADPVATAPIDAPVASSAAAPVTDPGWTPGFEVEPVSSSVSAPAGASSPTATADSAPTIAPLPPLQTTVHSDRGMLEVAINREDSIGMDLGSMIAEFQNALGAQLASDPQGHYDLAMSYCEMGLFDAAIGSFRLAAIEPRLRVRATEMVGRCLLDRGDFDEAAEQFESAIAMPELDPAAMPDLAFQLALALEAGGRMAESLEQFERIYAEQPNYPDVAHKIRALRKTLERH